MKNKVKSKNQLFSLLLVGLFAVGCGTSTEKQDDSVRGDMMEEKVEAREEDSTDNPMDEDMRMNSAEPEKSDSPVIENYLKIKNALVLSDSEDAVAGAKKLAEASDGSSIQLLQKINENAREIANSMDIEEQREGFRMLSKHIYTYAKENQTEDSKLYHQYCPMAFDNAGAYWISSKEEIMNPYFGDKMLRCGKVEEEI